MSAKENSTIPARKNPTLEQWKKLYEVAVNLKKMAPWRCLSDTDILALYLPDREEPVYCSVMGQGEMNYGIGVYPGHESYLRLKRIIDQDGYRPELLMFEQNCLMCNFGDREEVEAEDRAVMKQLGLRFRGRNQWVYFRSLVPGQLPWYLEAEQAELLTAALQNLFMLCLHFIEGNLELEEGKTLARWYDPETEMWMNGAVSIPEPKLERTLILQDDLLLARLKRGKRTGVRLELDSFYLPIPIRENKKVPPVCAQMTLLVDKETGEILDQSIDGPDEQALVTPLSILINYMEAHGRPAAVYVRSEWIGTLLRDTCKSVGVRLIENGVPVLDRLLEPVFTTVERRLSGSFAPTLR